MPRGFESIPNSRKTVLLTVFIGIYCILFFQYFNLQILNYEKYKRQSEDNSIRKLSIPAPRGIIYDRNGVPLVDNMPIYEVKVRPIDVTEEFDYEILSSELNLDVSDIQSNILHFKKTGGRFHPQLLKRHIDFEVISRLSEYKLNLPGLLFMELPARVYPSDVRLTHVLGYLRTVSEKFLTDIPSDLNYDRDDVHGAAGIELNYESILRGNNGFEYHLVDNRGIDQGVLLDEVRISPEKGKSLFLNIDHDLQLVVEELLDKHIGAIVCSNPNNGEIYAMASSPDYDLGSFVGPIPITLWKNWNTDHKRPLFNRALNGLYPPGSTLKLAAAAMLLETRKVTPSWMVDCRGIYSFGNRKYHCWKEDGHGQVNLKDAIKYSCNIYFYQLIQYYKVDEWAQYMTDFGFGEKTNIDLIHEKKGIIPNRDYLNKKYTSRGWAEGNLLSFVLGQGDVLTTPLQVLHMINLIATDGLAGKLNLANKNIVSLDTLAYSKRTWSFINNSMWHVVNGDKGTGENARSEFGIVRGKTGTAENPHGEPHSWFAGYITLPNEEKLSLAIIVENGGKGSQVAAPMAKIIFDNYGEKFHD